MLAFWRRSETILSQTELGYTAIRPFRADLAMKIQMTEDARKELFPGGFKPLYWALLVYVVLIPVGYSAATEAPGGKDWPLWSYAAVMHALICAVVSCFV